MSPHTSAAQLIPVEPEFKIMADSAPVMIWIAGLDKLCYFFNQGWLQFTGRTLQQEAGNGWAEGVHSEDFDKCLEIYVTSFDMHQAFKMEYRIKRYDGEYRWILDNGVPRYDENGQFAGYIGSCIDIHEIKEMEDRKDEFISAASHELKTPVTSLNLYISLIKDFLIEQNFPEQQLFIKKAEDQIAKLTNLVAGLLDVSKINANLMELENKAICYHSFIEEIVADLQALHTKHKIEFIAKSHVQIWGDTDRLSQVMINLLSNAVKYSPGKPTINLVITEKNGFVKTSITDYGVGIPAAHHHKIFDRFYRVTDKDVKTFPGLGIGLFITAEIIKMHGGRIWVDSEEAEYTTFSFTLPVYRQNNIHG